MSDDLGFDFARAAPWFPHDQESPYVLVRISDEHAKSWADSLGLAVRRCYVSDSLINSRAKELGVDKAEIIAARLPDAGRSTFRTLRDPEPRSARRPAPVVSTGPDKSSGGSALGGSCASMIARQPETPRSIFCPIRAVS